MLPRPRTIRETSPTLETVLFPVAIISSVSKNYFGLTCVTWHQNQQRNRDCFAERNLRFVFQKKFKGWSLVYFQSSSYSATWACDPLLRGCDWFSSNSSTTGCEEITFFMTIVTLQFSSFWILWPGHRGPFQPPLNFSVSSCDHVEFLYSSVGSVVRGWLIVWWEEGFVSGITSSIVKSFVCSFGFEFLWFWVSSPFLRLGAGCPIPTKSFEN